MSIASPLECRTEADCTQLSTSDSARPSTRKASTRRGQPSPFPYGVLLPHGSVIRSMALTPPGTRPPRRPCPRCPGHSTEMFPGIAAHQEKPASDSRMTVPDPGVNGGSRSAGVEQSELENRDTAHRRDGGGHQDAALANGNHCPEHELGQVHGGGNV